MSGILNTPVFLVLFGYLLINLIKTFVQARKVNHPTIFIYNFSISVFIFALFEALLLFDIIPYEKALLGCKLALGVFSLSSLAITGICVLDGITNKKLRTLWRLPLIGILAAWYLKPVHVVWMFIAAELISLLIFFKVKENYKYNFRQQFKSVFGLILISLSSFSTIWLFNLGFLLFLIMKLQIINAVKLKIAIDDYKKTEEVDA